MKTVLFLCTGNYYRSRYAEILFNLQAQQTGLAWKAVSRGLNPESFRIGPMSRDAIAALMQLGIPLGNYMRFPLLVTGEDFETADHVVAVKEAEHRPMIQRKFPQWLARVEFWQIHDLDYCEPAEALPELDREVADLVRRFAQAETGP